MAHVFDVVKASCPKSSVVKQPSPVRVWAVPMTMARILKSRMRLTSQVRFGSGGGVSDGPADHNLGGALIIKLLSTKKAKVCLISGQQRRGTNLQLRELCAN